MKVLGGIGEALSDRNFRIYSVGAIVSWLSFFVQMVAISWTTWELTHSTTWLAVVATLDVAPSILVLPIAGVMADRYDRYRIVVVTHLLSLVQAAILTGLSYSGHLSIGPLAVLACLHGTVVSLSMPGLYGMLPRFVARERLASAIAVNSAYTQFAIFAGPALAGWIILQFGAAAAFATNVLGYVIYLVSIAALRTPADFKAPLPTGKSVAEDLRDGLSYIIGHRGISALLLLMLTGDALSTALYQMLPAYAEEILGMGVDGMATLLASAGLGATISALWIAHGGIGRAGSQRVIWAFFVCIISVAALMFTKTVVPAIVAMLVFGLAGELRRTGTVALLQTAVVDSQRGRLMSTQFLLQRIAGGVGTILIGAAAEHHGLRWPILVAAGIATAAWMLAFRNRHRIETAFRSDRN
jgi:MFS family permease